MEAKIEKISELSKLLSVKTRMSDDLFHLFGKFGIGHLLSRLSLEKHDGVSASQATCSLVYFSTKKLHNLAFSINFAIFANCLIHMYHMFVEIIDISYYEFKL